MPSAAAPAPETDPAPRTRTDALLAALLALAGATLLAAVWAFSGKRATPLVADEWVYLFQAKTLLHGRLAFPPPPLPEFFEAPHLLVVPTYAAKYFPGHALVLAPFLAAGAPWLAPCLLLGGAAALVFAALRRLGVGRPFALAGGALWLASADNLSTFGSYLSQSTSAFLVALALWLAAGLRARATTAGLAALSAAAAFALAVRPFTGVALLALVVWAFVRHARDLRARAALLVPLALGGLLLLGCARHVTGEWTRTPWGLYARQYTPFDGPGIGAPDAAAPEREVPPHLAPMVESFRGSRARLTAAGLPGHVARLASAAKDFAPGGALILALALVGVFLGGGALLPALLFAVAYFVLQAGFHAEMTFYLAETWVPLALAAAAGAQWLARLAPLVRDRRARAAALALGLGLPALWAATDAALQAPRAGKMGLASLPHVQAIEGALAPAKSERGLVFVRTAAGAEVGPWYNEPDLARAPVVLAFDRGADNARLRARFPDRPAFLFDEATLRLTRLP